MPASASPDAGRSPRSGSTSERANGAHAAVFIVHSLTHAVAALEAAAEARRAITLLSAPAAGIYAGPGWWKAVIDAARGAVPAARFVAILDCGGDAGAAQGAIRAGVETLVFTGRADAAERLKATAAAMGSQLLTQRPDAVLDLGRWFFADGGTLRARCAEVFGAAGRQ